MTVLNLSTSTNEHAKSIAGHITKGGHSVIQVNFDQVTNGGLIMDVGASCIRINREYVDTDEISGVFVHHPLVDISKSVGGDDLDRKIIAASWKSYIDWLEAKLTKSVWINKVSASRESSPSLKQLQVAASIGFRVPRSIFTNDIDALKRTFNGNQSVVLKPGALGLRIPGQRILTHVVDVESLGPEDILQAPCFFQEYIDKRFELRVHVIGNEVYTCEIDSQASDKTKFDWRNYDIAHTPHRAYMLDDATAVMCRKVTTELGLLFGVIDLIVAKDGSIVFLECNSQGHWLWIEELTKLPITASIANALIQTDTPK